MENFKRIDSHWINQDSPWNMIRGKYLFENPKILNKESKENNLLSLTLNGVLNKDMSSDEGLRPDSYDSYQIFYKNDLVFKLIDLENVTTSRVGWVHEKGLMSPVYIRLKSKEDKSNTRFFYYYYFDLYQRHIFNSIGSGIRSSLSGTNLLELLVPNPSHEEQNKIVDFLDKKTTHINELIKKIEQKIELLKEQKNSLISEVVTKGLNPDVDMKDSGFEWIGEIPSHWNYKRMCHMFRPVSIKNNFDEMNLSVYRDYGVIPTHSRDDNHNVISEDTSNYKLVDIGDFVMNKMKCWMGSLGLSDFRGIVSPSYTVMKPLTEDNRKFLHFLLRSKVYIPQYKRLSYGIRTGQWDLHYKDFRELPCLIPPLKEQKQIVEYIDKYIKLTDESITKETERLTLLKEYKQSLISEVVTGKKRVV